MKIFAERIKELREERKLTMSQLAKELGIRQSTISRWERGERLPNLDAIIALAKFFKLSTDYLCGLED